MLPGNRQACHVSGNEDAILPGDPFPRGPSGWVEPEPCVQHFENFLLVSPVYSAGQEFSHCFMLVDNLTQNTGTETRRIHTKSCWPVPMPFISLPAECLSWAGSLPKYGKSGFCQHSTLSDKLSKPKCHKQKTVIL